MHRVSAIQMNSGPEVAENLLRAERLIDQAVSNGASLVVLPENFALMPRHESDRMHVAEREGSGPIQSFLGHQSQKSGIWIVAGTIPLIAKQTGKFYASCLVYQPNGELSARYNKIHLFDVAVSDVEAYKESEYFEPGSTTVDNLVCVDTPMGRIGLTICYDVRFPELYRDLSRDGAILFSIPSAFTATTGRAHWNTLLRARAIENLAYVIASAQSGSHASGRETYGHSMIIDPWGDILDQLTDEPEGVITADIDQDKLLSVRQRFPSLKHRRL